MFNFNTTKRHSDTDMFNPNTDTANGGADNIAANPNTGASSAKSGANLGASEAEINSRINELEAQRREFMRKNPNFDMKSELKNPKFAEYIFKNSLSLEEAYTLVHLDELMKSAAMNALNRASARRDRIYENGTGKNSPAVVKKNPKDMSDKEIDSIIERVRGGEKISF